MYRLVERASYPIGYGRHCNRTRPTKKARQTHGDLEDWTCDFGSPGSLHGGHGRHFLTACNGPPPSPDTFLTRAERTDYRETSSYADVVDFLERAAASSPSVHYTTYGYTNEGRALPLAVVGDVADPSPASVRASGKTVVYLQGNIHGGEVCGKEALQMLLRDLLAGRHPRMAGVHGPADRAHLQRGRQ